MKHYPEKRLGKFKEKDHMFHRINIIIHLIFKTAVPFSI